MAVTKLRGCSWIAAGEADFDDGALASSAEDNRTRQKVKEPAEKQMGRP